MHATPLAGGLAEDPGFLQCTHACRAWEPAAAASFSKQRMPLESGIFFWEYPVSIPGLFRYAEVRQRDRKHVLSWAGGMWECCWNLSGTKNKSNHNLSCALLRELVFKRAGVPTRPLCRHRSYCFVGKGFHDSLKTSRPESIQTRLGYRVKAVWRGSHVGVTKL